MRKMLKILGLILVAILAVVAIAIALNFTYLKRTFTGFDVEQVREVDWYQPQVKMSAGEGIGPLIRSEKLGEQDQRFSEAIAYAEQINSSAFLVYQGGELVLEKYWQPYHANSYTQTQSVHKSLLSLAVGVALESGDISSLADPVSDYLGDWTDQSQGEISIEHLLNMTSGLGKDPVGFFLFEHFLRLLNAPDISKVAQSLPQKLPPGQEFEYINTNTQLLVDVLEAATGQPYEIYLQDKIWSKMAANPGYLWMDRRGGTPHGYCCLMALPEDLLRIGLLILNKGSLNGQQIVPESWVEQMAAPSDLNPNYGYLVWLGTEYEPMRKYSQSSEFGVLHSEPYLADDVVYFDGFGGQRVYIVPSKELVIVRVGETRFDFDDSTLPNAILRAINEDGIRADAGSLHEVETADQVLNTAHSGEIAVRVAYPKSAAEQFPLIIFSHGSFLSGVTYDVILKSWAAQGYVVVAPTHMDTGGLEAAPAIQGQYGQDWITATRVLDLKASIDSIDLLTADLDGFKGSVRTEEVIAAGHSHGALIAQFMAGATYSPLGDSVNPLPEQLKDDRISAVVALSPPGLIPNYLSEEAWSTLSTPQLVVTGTADVQPPLWSNYEDHLVSYESANPGNNYLLVLDGADHYFGNLFGKLELEAPSQTQELNHFIERSLVFMSVFLQTGNTQNEKEALDAFLAVGKQAGIVRYEKR